jgi:hypothetical protein
MMDEGYGSPCEVVYFVETVVDVFTKLLGAANTSISANLVT